MKGRPIVSVVFATFEGRDPSHPVKLQLLYENQGEDVPCFCVRELVSGTAMWLRDYNLARELFTDCCELHGAPTFRAVVGQA